MIRQTDAFRDIADSLIAATNTFDVEKVLGLFTPDAVIDDPSTGHRFDGHAGIRDYVERYFIGYHTVTRFLSLDVLDDNMARVRVDFTGDFGHEIGLLEISSNADGLIARIDAALEQDTQESSTTMQEFMIYGATGYTGRMVAEHARAAGLPFVLAGRRAEPIADTKIVDL